MTDQPPNRRLLLIAALVIALLGIALRVVPSAGFKGVGFDEVLYRQYVEALHVHGLGSFPDLCATYIAKQEQPNAMAMLPPTRFLYIFTAWVWREAAFGITPALADLREPQAAERDPALIALHRTSCLFTTLLFLASGVFAWRMLGPRFGVGVLALMAAAPTQLQLSQHALIDGFFGFWALMCLWMLWENLQRPNHAGWQLGYTVCGALMVTTKENSAFIFVALGALIVANRWLHFGTVTPRLLLLTAAAPLLGLAILVNLTGSPATFIHIYQLLVSKANALPYAIKTGDGPWYRYFVDVMLVSPIILIIAIGGIFTLTRQHRAYAYLLLFMAASYALMCNVKYAMNLRYATIWDMPLRMFVFGQLSVLTAYFGKRQTLVLIVAVAALCAYELRQYVIFFVDFRLYELVSEGLLRAIKILK